MNDTKNPLSYGLIIEEKTASDWEFGSRSLPSYATKEILKVDGNWFDKIPDVELQNKFSFESMACASFHTLNPFEMLLDEKYHHKFNGSDRFLAKVSETSQNGNSPKKVAEALRKIGVPKEEEWPFTGDINTWDKFYSPIPPELYEKAREFVDNWTLKYYHVPSNIDAIKDALKFSPLGIAVFAWKEENGVHVQAGKPNHWTTCYGYDDDKKALKIFDSYNSTQKLYSYDSNIPVIFGYYINKNRKTKSWPCRKWGILCD